MLYEVVLVGLIQRGSISSIVTCTMSSENHRHLLAILFLIGLAKCFRQLVYAIDGGGPRKRFDVGVQFG